MTVKVGDPAPDFELFGEWDREAGAYAAYRLGDELKERPIVMHFFPAPFTRVCETQMCDVRDHAEDVYGARGVAVWGVTGHYPWLIERWERENHFGVPILADYEHSVSEDYVGTYAPEKMNGLRHITRRAVVSASQDGVVRFAWITDDPNIGPSDDIVAAAIESSLDQGTRATNGA